MRKSNKAQLADIVKKMGGTSKGVTTWDVFDELEEAYDGAHQGGGGAPIATEGLSDDDIEDVFEEDA
jgi:hypothetical protein